MDRIVKESDIVLKELKPEMVTDDYVKWLNDPDNNRYLESRFSEHTLESTKDFIDSLAKSDNNYMFGIFLDGTHVGNIKIGNIDRHHDFADIGLIIGKPYWGKGIGTVAIGKVMELAFETYGLHKLVAGIYGENKGSMNAFLKNGWEIVGSYKKHVKLDGKYQDSYILEVINTEGRS